VYPKMDPKSELYKLLNHLKIPPPFISCSLLSILYIYSSQKKIHFFSLLEKMEQNTSVKELIKEPLQRKHEGTPSKEA
jgi:hypothetical protein